MSEGKICPIMSRPFVAIAANQLPYGVNVDFKNDLCYTFCQKEKCMAWSPETEPSVNGCGLTPKGAECKTTLGNTYPNLDFDGDERWLWCDSCAESKYIGGRSGYCKLIERGS